MAPGGAREINTNAHQILTASRNQSCPPRAPGARTLAPRGSRKTLQPTTKSSPRTPCGSDEPRTEARPRAPPTALHNPVRLCQFPAARVAGAFSSISRAPTPGGGLKKQRKTRPPKTATRMIHGPLTMPYGPNGRARSATAGSPTSHRLVTPQRRRLALSRPAAKRGTDYRWVAIACIRPAPAA